MMNTTKTQHMTSQRFFDPDYLYELLNLKSPTDAEVNDILNRASQLKGLPMTDVARLLLVSSPEQVHRIMLCAKRVKDEIYGRRLVLFAPLYTGNKCDNNCTYCAFRKSNQSLKRKVLSMKEIETETKSLLHEGHKRLLLICGESEDTDVDYMCDAMRTVYGVSHGNSSIRRVNLELAPMEVNDFVKLKQENPGTYICFQETYDPALYKTYHPAGTPKADYEYRLTVMDRAMAGGIDDVGLGVLFGLADYRFDVLALMAHATHLENTFGCGPHTVSFPRIEPADNAPLTEQIPFQVSDADFKKIIAIMRIALPYTGIILSTRENEEMRTVLFQHGVSQISAGSRTNPGAYACGGNDTGRQFALGDHRSLEEVIRSVIEKDYVPSFCTGCYRKGRVGNDFMDLAKPGLIKRFCTPNALFTFREYLEDFASSDTRVKGEALISKMLNAIEGDGLQNRTRGFLNDIAEGKRDMYF